jgi:acetylornithine/N-succinyldiaminopimelate aminotransferase
MIDDFLRYQTQTTPSPMGLSVARAQGSYVYDTDGKPYLDFVAGVSACSVGHCHPKVVAAIQKQAQEYLHVMVYGEFAQGPAVAICKQLAAHLPDTLESTYLVNSGTEAIEAALKLARIATGRTELIYAQNAYHGNTMGAMSVMDYDQRKAPFEPLIPDCRSIPFNEVAALDTITEQTAAVILETIQGGAGFIVPDKHYMTQVRKRCTEVGALLILDEIQPGFGRTGRLFAFEHFDIVPDVLVMGKGMGGGLPIGALSASQELMKRFSTQPKLGHITTFGGHPLIASAALATLEIITESHFMNDVQRKEVLIRQHLQHPLIDEIRGMGLMLAMIMPHKEIADKVVLTCQERGLLLFWLLYEERAVRLTPPLTVSEDEITEGCRLILQVLDEIHENT